MPAMSSEQARALQAKRIRYGASNARSEARKLQRLVMADALKEDLKPVIRVACVRAWDILEERLRILNNRPLPGFLRPDLPPERRRKKPIAPAIATLPELAPPDSSTVDGSSTIAPKESLSTDGGAGGVPGEGPGDGGVP